MVDGASAQTRVGIRQPAAIRWWPWLLHRTHTGPGRPCLSPCTTDAGGRAALVAYPVFLLPLDKRAKGPRSNAADW